MRRVRIRRLVLGYGLGVLGLGAQPSLAGARPARPPAPPLLLHVSPCLAAVLDESEVARLVAIELGPRPSAGPGESLPRLQAQLDCSDGSPQLADLTVEERATRRALLRTVDLSAQAQPLHARLIALSLAELVHAIESERWEAQPPAAGGPASEHTGPTAAPLSSPPRPGPPAAAPRAAAPAPPPPTTAQPSAPTAAPPSLSPPEPRLPPLGGLYLQAGFALLVPLSGPSAPLHVGAGLRLGGDHRYHLGWDFDAQVATTRRRTALGEIESDLLSSRATLQAHLAWSRLLLRGGLGLRVGGVRLTGSPGDGALTTAREAWAPFGGPLLSLGLAFAPHSLRRLRADLTSEAGYLLWSATARVDGQSSLALAGPWIGLSLSLGLSF